MSELIIKNGIVYDPLNSIDGEKMDICIRDGKIVKTVKDSAKVVDASGMMIMPGGVDIHSHIAGGEVDTGRLLRPEDRVIEVFTSTSVIHSPLTSVIHTSYI